LIRSQPETGTATHLALPDETLLSLKQSVLGFAVVGQEKAQDPAHRCFLPYFVYGIQAFKARFFEFLKLAVLVAGEVFFPLRVFLSNYQFRA
jgi:hypothetical protein